MANRKVWLLLVSLVCAHDILQLSSEVTPLSLPSSVLVELQASPCASRWDESTLSGWFHPVSATPTVLLAVTTPAGSLTLHKDPSGQVEALIGKREKGQSILLSVNAGSSEWVYVSLAQSQEKKTIQLCVAPWTGKMECMSDEMPDWVGPMDLAAAQVTLGAGEVLDVLVTSVALSTYETERLSNNNDCDESCHAPVGTLHQSTTLLSVCASNGIVDKAMYSDSELHHSYEWDWGLNMFMWDTYYYYPNTSTVKAVFVLDDDIGDPDFSVWHCGYVTCDYEVAKSKKVGPDTITVDWNTHGYESGMTTLQAMAVYITGKSWFNWYTITFNYYSTEWTRVSSGKALSAVQEPGVRVVKRPWGTIASCTLLVGVATAAFLLCRRLRRKKETTNESLLDRLLIKREDE